VALSRSPDRLIAEAYPSSIGLSVGGDPAAEEPTGSLGGP
jgi:hypothetical protein